MRIGKFLLVSVLMVSAGFLGYNSLDKASQKDMPEHYEPYEPQGISFFDRKAREAQGYIQYMFGARVNPFTGIISSSDVKKAYEVANYAPMAKNTTDVWENIGPDNIGGRTRAIIVDNENNNIVYAGAASGGFWKSDNFGDSWSKKDYTGDFTNLCIVSMTQASNGDLYFSTGEMNLTLGASDGVGNSGNIGMGIWKSTDRGETWEHLEATIPASKFSNTSLWDNVSDIVADPNNPQRIVAATDAGLYETTDGGENWDRIELTPIFNTRAFIDLEVSNDGNLWFASTRTNCLRSTDGKNFTNVSGSADGLLPVSDVGRLDMAISPQDNNYVYASLVTQSGAGVLKGIYQSTDGGQNWSSIGEGGGAFDPFSRGVGQSGQGQYDNIIAVDPFKKDKIYVGGINFWTWNAGQWYQSASSNSNARTGMHVDHHEITFDVTDPDNPLMYIGNDGGIYKSNDFHVKKYPSWNAANQNYNTTQFYAIDISKDGQAFGGTQDNNSLRLEPDGLTGESATDIKGGDGFYTAVSTIDPNIVMYESQYANMVRSQDKGNSSTRTKDLYENGIEWSETNNEGFAPFNTPFRLWESFNDSTAYDSVSIIGDTSVIVKAGETVVDDALQNDPLFEPTGNTNEYRAKVDINLLPGTEVEVQSKNSAIFNYVLERSVPANGAINIPDQVQSIFIMVWRNTIYATRDILNFNKGPEWVDLTHQVTDYSGMSFPRAIEFTPDGNTVYIGGGSSFSGGGKVYRISNLKEVVMRRLYKTIKRVNQLNKPDEVPERYRDKYLPYAEQTIRDFFDTIPPQVVDQREFKPEEEGLEIEELATFGSQTVTGIGVDPNDGNKVVVTLGNYGTNLRHVYVSDNALDTADNVVFNSIDNNGGVNRLPSMPVYDALIPASSSNDLILATELGIFTYDFSNPTGGFSEFNTGEMERVPTLMLRQINEHPDWTGKGPVVYAGTHGRGILKTGFFDPLLSTPGNEEADLKAGQLKLADVVNVYPNPAQSYTTVEIELAEDQNVDMQLYDIRGSLIQSKNGLKLREGVNTQEFNLTQLKTGTYFVRVSNGEDTVTKKVLVAK